MAAVRYAAGGTAAASASGPVAALVEGVSRAMILQRLLGWTAVILVIGAVACGAVMGMLARSEPPEHEQGTVCRR